MTVFTAILPAFLTLASCTPPLPERTLPALGAPPERPYATGRPPLGHGAPGGPPWGRDTPDRPSLGHGAPGGPPWGRDTPGRPPLGHPVADRPPLGHPVADRPPRAPSPAGTARALRRLVADGAPGAAALATDEGGPARFAAAGVADLRTGRPMRRADRFRAGSLTKPFVAAVVLQLAAEHRLSLDAGVTRYLPGTAHAIGPHGAARLARVTTRQLLGHTSGLFDYTRDAHLARALRGPGFAAHRYDTHTPAALLRVALRHRPVATPGTRYAYSNTNYLLLGLLIERLTGHPYAREIRRRVLVPLHLTGTSFPGTSSALPAPHGRAYSVLGAHRVDSTALNPSRAGAAGEMVTTLDDLNRFFTALLSGRLLPRRQTRIGPAASPVYGEAAPPSYAPGLYPTDLPCGITVWGHNGEINGSSARTAATRDGRHVLTLRINTDTLDTPSPGADTDALTAEFCGRRP
ncbi:serine hydrolase [Streptomyces sp. NPDC003077]|uniref:serine hydrolase domain-containing protein n=1 Tax=Streptomyces sp. NPDC003077 TaxID=3154443 RepID=UPI0033BEBE80